MTLTPDVCLWCLGPLADRKLLLLSKKIGSGWEQLGALLKVPEEDIQDIKVSRQLLLSINPFWGDLLLTYE